MHPYPHFYQVNAAAEADNAIGSYGVAPAAEILPIKACHPKEEGGLSARCTTSSLVTGVAQEP